MEACVSALPVDVAICAAAVSDWRVRNNAAQKMKKDGSGEPPLLALVENPDILAGLAQRHTERPRLVIGFAAETERVTMHARAKRERKGCDWIVANDVSKGVMGGDRNTVHLVTARGVDSWPTLTKTEVAARLCRLIGDALGQAAVTP